MYNLCGKSSQMEMRENLKDNGVQFKVLTEHDLGIPQQKA